MRLAELDRQAEFLQRQLSILTGIVLGDTTSPYGKYFPAKSSSKLTPRETSPVLQCPPQQEADDVEPTQPAALVEKHLDHKDKGIRFPLSAVIIPVIPHNRTRQDGPARLTTTTYLSMRPNPAVVALGEPLPPRHQPKGDGSFVVRFN